MSRVLDVENYLDSLIPEPWCELNFNKDYELLIAIVLSAQTTDKRVNQVTSVLFDKYKDLESLSKAKLSDVENILRPIGTFSKKAIYVIEISKILHNEYNDTVPINRKQLEKLPGVGRKTINVFLCEFYNIPTLAVDTHVDRVSKRLGLVKKDDDVYNIELKLKRKFKRDNWCKRHKQLVLFGRYYCKAVKPECSSCGLKDICKEMNKNV